MTKNWWIWTAWVECGGEITLIYGCAAQTERPPCQFPEEFPLANESVCLKVERSIVSAVTAQEIFTDLEAGIIDLSRAFDRCRSKIPVKARRYLIHDVFGHSAAKVDACYTLPDPLRIAPPATWRSILQQLETTLGLPFTKEYASHVGNFEVIHLQRWLEQPPPFTIEAVGGQDADVREDKGIRLLQICRSEEFAQEAHLAHVACHNEGGRLLDRIIVLGKGELRSPVIEASEGIASLDFSLYDHSGEVLIHRETQHFLTQINLIMSMKGRRLHIEDRLTKAAQNRSRLLGQSASVVEAHSSQRSKVSFEGDASKWIAHRSRMLSLVKACFPPSSEDRWFSRSLDDEVGVIQHFNRLLDGGHIEKAVLIDPFFWC